MAEFLPRLFQNVGLTKSEITDALLVFVSEPDRQAGMLLSPDWPLNLRDRIDSAFATQTLRALSQGEASRGIAELVELFAQLARDRTMAAVADE